MNKKIKETRKAWSNGANAPENIEHIFHVGTKRIGSIFEPSTLRKTNPKDYRLNIADGYFGKNSYHPTFEAALATLISNV